MGECPEKCPKCGADEKLGMLQDWSCGSIEEADESITESEMCLRRQLSASQALNAEWEAKAKNWMASPDAAQRLDGYREFADQLAAANERVAELEKERDSFRDALQYYANPAVWDKAYDDIYDCSWASIELDKGNIARKALGGGK